MSDNLSIVGLIGLIALVAALIFVPLGVVAGNAENHPDHMTQYEQNACLKRIEQKLDQLLEKQCAEK